MSSLQANRRNENRKSPREDFLLFALVSGLLGSLTIAREHIGNFYYECSGSQAVLIGYIIGFAAWYGIYCYFRSAMPVIRVRKWLFAGFSALYALCVAVPFGLEALPSSRAGVAAFVGTSVIVLVLGHVFHMEVRKGLQGAGQNPNVGRTGGHKVP